ncbi:MAG TPA: hypothetical protein VFZ61_07900, partial [Polyangiales bacterium]
MRRHSFLSWFSLSVCGSLFTPACSATHVPRDGAVEGSDPEDAGRTEDAETGEDAAFEDAASTEDAEVEEDAGADASRELDASEPDDAQAEPPDAADAGTSARPTAVDVLLMIDNSGSMTQEQTKLAQLLDEFFAILVTGRLDPQSNARPDFVGSRSVHV